MLDSVFNELRLLSSKEFDSNSRARSPLVHRSAKS
jgi:hypothetical protein